jgi:PAS domain S-box-containing protein
LKNNMSHEPASGTPGDAHAAPPTPLHGHAVAIALLAAALACAYAAERFAPDLRWAPFLAAVAVSAWYGGRNPTAMVLAAGYAGMQLLGASRSAESNGFASVAYLALGALIGALVCRARAGEAAAMRAARTADERLGAIESELDRLRAAAAAHAPHGAPADETRAREDIAALVELMPVPVYIAHDPDCHNVTTNHAGKELLAAPHAGAHPVHAHRVWQNGRELGPHEMPIQRAAAHGTPTFGEEYEIRYDDGAAKYVYGYAVPLYAADGRTRGSVGVFIDVTERRHIQDALRDSEQRFRMLADNAPVMIWIADAARNWTYLNRTWRTSTGRGAHDYRGMRWLEWVHPDDRDAVAAGYDTQFARREPFALEMRLKRADGAYRWMANTGMPLYGRDGSFHGYIGTCTDITAGKLDAQRLEQAGRQKDEFITTLAHELRNPLAPIRNALHILRGATADSSGARWAREVIERQVSQLVRLVDDLLDIARIARGELELRLETLDLEAIVRDALEASRPLVDAARHRLHVDMPATPLAVHADRTRAGEILVNLVNNAAKYTPAGGNVWVSCERAGDEVVVRVRDDGIGIAPEALARIFDMYTQVDDSRERSQGGLGVGLALARKLAELLGGRLHAHSDGPGRGSEFVLCLPLATEAPRCPSAREPEAPAFDGDSEGCRVLVVDDSADTAESLSMLLQLDGHTVETANDGAAALERLAAFRPEIVILDIGLPGMTGYEVARRIRGLPSGEDLILIALTGWGRDEERACAFEAGFDHHLTKPVSVAELRRMVAPRAEAHA